MTLFRLIPAGKMIALISANAVFGNRADDTPSRWTANAWAVGILFSFLMY
jgi:hypothetical protein